MEASLLSLAMRFVFAQQQIPKAPILKIQFGDGQVETKVLLILPPQPAIPERARKSFGHILVSADFQQEHFEPARLVQLASQVVLTVEAYHSKLSNMEPTLRSRVDNLGFLSETDPVLTGAKR